MKPIEQLAVLEAQVLKFVMLLGLGLGALITLILVGLTYTIISIHYYVKYYSVRIINYTRRRYNETFKHL